MFVFMDITPEDAFIRKEDKMKKQKTALIGGTPATLESAREIFTSVEKSRFPRYWYKPVFRSYWLGSCRARCKSH